MKLVGLRQSPVSSPSAPKSSEPASDGKVRASGVLADVLRGGQQRGASGSAMRTGDSRSDNCQTVCYQPKKDGFEPPGTMKSLATRGGIGSGRGGDNVMLGEDRYDGDRFSPKPLPPPEKPIRSIGDLLRRLFEGLKPTPAPTPDNSLDGGQSPGTELPGKWSPIKIGGGHADNISKGPGGDNDGADAGFAPPSAPRSRFEQLLERLFSGGWGQVMGRADKPGNTNTNNVMLNAHPGRDQNIL